MWADDSPRRLPTADLHQLCRDGCLEELSRELHLGYELENRFSARVGKAGFTPLHVAVECGQVDVVRLLLDYDAPIEARTFDQSTPLHLAVQRGRLDCVRLLLRYGARTETLDRENSNPRMRVTRDLHRQTRKAALNLFVSRELVCIATEKPNELESILQKSVDLDQMVPADLQRVFFAACQHGILPQVQRLVEYVVHTSLHYAITISSQHDNHEITMLLMLCKAAIDGRVDLIRFLYGDHDEALRLEPPEWYISEAHIVIPAASITTYMPIKLALARKNDKAAHELLMRTELNRHQGVVDWNGLELTTLESHWMTSIEAWCIKFIIANNALKELPSCLFKLRGLKTLDLSNNKLGSVPPAIFCMPQLQQLHLHGNCLTSIPDIQPWTATLHYLDLSKNYLHLLPDGIRSSKLDTLLIGKNTFSTIPSVIGQVRSLTTLDISNLPRVRSLPKALGHLTRLKALNIIGVQVNNIPAHVRGTRDVISYLRTKLRDCQSLYRMKLVVVGEPQTGKTTVVAGLRGEKSSSSDDGASGELGVHTLKISGSGWRKPKYIFSIWDFSGFEDYRSMHHCLLSPHAVYLVVWRIIDGATGIQRLRFWLDNIVTYAPDSPVIVVATHTDRLNNEQIAQGYCGNVRERLARLITQQPGYQTLTFHGMVETSGGGEHISNLKHLIYRAAGGVLVDGKPLISRSVPASYGQLADRLHGLRHERKTTFQCPILEWDALWTLVRSELTNNDISTEEELRDAVKYLHITGSILHFNVPHENLDRLLFIDPHWLYAMLARLVMARNRSVFQKTGFLRLSDLGPIYACHRFPPDYHRAFLQLLNRFGVAIIWDEQYFFVKNMLADLPPRDLDRLLPADHLQSCYSRTYRMNVMPISFESRLLARILVLLKQWMSQCDITVADSKMNFSSSGMVSEASKEAAGSAGTSLLCWRNGIAFVTAEVWFIVQSKIATVTNTTRGLTIRVSRNDHGNRLMALLVTAIFALMRDWFPHLLVGDERSMATIQTISCPSCQERCAGQDEDSQARSKSKDLRLSASTRLPSLSMVSDSTGSSTSSNVIDFTYGMCVEALLASDTITCRRCKQNVQLRELIPELLLVHSRKYPIVDYAGLGVNDLQRKCCLMANASEGRGEFNGEAVTVRVFTTNMPAVQADTFDDEIDRALEDVDEPLLQTPRQVILEKAYHQLRLESTGMALLEHPNLIHCVALCLRPPAIVFPIANLQPLSSLLFLTDNGQLAPVSRLFSLHCSAQIAGALVYLHEKKCAHGGLSANAIALCSLSFEDEVTVKVGSLAMIGRVWPSGMRGLRGERGYQPPEVLRYNGEEEYDGLKADIFSFGILLYEMMSRQPVSNNEDSVTESVTSGWRPPLLKTVSSRRGLPAMAAAAIRCWRGTPQARPAAEQCHSMLRALDSSMLLSGCSVHLSSQPRLAQLVESHQQLWLCDENRTQGSLLLVLECNTLKKLALYETANSRVMCLCPVLLATSSTQTLWLGLLNRTLQIIDCNKYHCIQETSLPDVASDMAAGQEHVYVALAGGSVIAINTAQPVKSGKLCCTASHIISGKASVRSIVLVRGEEAWCACGNGIVFLKVPGLERLGEWHGGTNETVSDLTADDRHQCVWSFMWRTLDVLCWRSDSSRQLLLRLPLSELHFAKECSPVQEEDLEEAASNSDSSANDPLSKQELPAAQRMSMSVPPIVANERWIQRVLPVFDTLWVGLADGRIVILDSQRMQLLGVLSAHIETVRCLMYISDPNLSDNGHVVSGGGGMQSGMRYLLSHLDNALEISSSQWPCGSGEDSEIEHTGSVLLWDALPAASISAIQQRQRRHQ